MNKKEIKAQIRAKEKEERNLRNKIAASKDIEEVRSLGEALDKLRDDIDELMQMLDELEEQEYDDRNHVPEDAERRGFDGVKAAFGGSSIKGSFNINGGSVKPETVNSIALRSNETLVSRLPQTERKPLDLGKYVRGAITGDWNNALEERAAFSSSTTGVLIPQMLSAQVIDKARNVSLFASAGVPIVPMESNNLTIARVASDPEFAFKEELAEADESSFSLEPVELKAKTAYGYAYCSLETIHSATNLTDILYKVFSQAFADMCDRGMLYGQLTALQTAADYAPAGIMNDSDINVVEASNRYYDDFIKAIGKIRRANGNPTVAGMNAATEEYISLLKDANGQIMAEPKAYAELIKVVSNQLIEDEENGSDALVFDPNAMIIGFQNRLVFRMFQDTDYCISHGAVGFQIYAMLDCAAVQPKHITKITGIKETAVSDNSSDD